MASKNVEVFGARVLATGVRQVELLGGWVSFDLLKPAVRNNVEVTLANRLDSAQWRNWEQKNVLSVSFDDSQDDYEPPKQEARLNGETGDQDGDGNGPKEQQDSGDDGDDGEDSESEPKNAKMGDQFGDGDDQAETDGDAESGDDDTQVPPPPSGDGDGDDAPVMHSEFDPWAEQISAAVIKHGDRLDKAADVVKELRADVSTLKDAADVTLKGIKELADLRHSDVARIAALEANQGNGNGGIIVKIEVVKPGEPQYDKDGVFHNQFPKLLKLVAGGHHVYLPGPPGSGKSHAALQVSQVLGWRFGSISLGPTTPESRLMGGMDANGNFHCPAFVEGLIYAEENPDSGFVFCEDELDNGHPGIIATQNSVMANGFITLPNGRTVTVGDNWVVVGSANTYGTGPTAEFSGRNRLDAATLDRFRYLPWDTDKAMEATMVKGILHEDLPLAADWLDAWESARKNVESHGLKVFITMRGALAGAKMLAQGFDLFDTMDIVLLNKLPQDQAAKINPL